MFDDVWQRAVGGDYRHAPARLYGYRRLKVRHEVYPGLVPAAPEFYVDGRLYFSVGSTDIRRLDHFEGPTYRKESVQCRLTETRVSSAEVYVFKKQYRRLLVPEDWDPVEFEKNGLGIFLARYRGFR